MELIRRYGLYILLAVAAVPLYFLYIHDLTKNPPVFFIDEALASYNAYNIRLSGHGEFGNSWPLYFPVLQVPGSTNAFLGYLDPVQVYILAGLFVFFAPGVLLPRLVSATAMFLASAILGLLGKRISGRLDIGIIVALTALVTPWLYEGGRTAFGAALYPLVIVLFLLFLHIAHKKQRWSILNIVLLAIGLALATYTYSIGRLLGPVLALGLVLFATDREHIKDVVKTWIAYAVTLIPLLIFHLRNPGALSGRYYTTVGIIDPDSTFSGVASIFLSNFAANLDPRHLLLIGDTNLRHHITDTGAIFATTFILVLGGIVLVLLKHRSDPWWRYMIFGLFASIVPASLTRDIFHMLRLSAFPVFLLILTVPALMWLLSVNERDAEDDPTLKRSPFLTRRGYALIALLVLTFAQTVYFQSVYRRVGLERSTLFDQGYRSVFNAAVARSSRPIYLVDGYWGQAYVLGYWYAAMDGIDRSNFVHVMKGQKPPFGALVISADDKCDRCEPVYQDGQYVLYIERSN